jgi:hypothetical protein
VVFQVSYKPQKAFSQDSHLFACNGKQCLHKVKDPSLSLIGIEALHYNSNGSKIMVEEKMQKDDEMSVPQPPKMIRE